MRRPPNVLMICVDDLRADHLGCAGNPLVRTPSLDALAARGTLFTRAYCNNPVCMPSRATMFTGLLPRDHGVRVNGHALRRDLPCLPAVLRDAGYRTHAAGKLHFTPWVPKIEAPDLENFPEEMDAWNGGAVDALRVPYYGFETVDLVCGHGSWVWGPYLDWLRERDGDRALLGPETAGRWQHATLDCFKMSLPPELHYNRYVADSTIRLIEESSRDRETCKPFFAWCSFPDPHPPQSPPRPYCDMYDPREMPLPHRRAGELERLPPFYRRIMSGEIAPSGCSPAGVTDDQWRAMLAMTFGMITHVDHEVGRVLEALSRSGQVENTVVIFTGDHGDLLGDHGLNCTACYTFRGCVEVPMIVAAPGAAARRGQRCGQLISHIDLMPSVLDLCGLPLPHDEWRQRQRHFDQGSVQELMTYPGRSWAAALRGESLPPRPVVIECDDTTTGLRPRCLVTERHRITVYPGLPDGELFDLSDDPWELHNLWYEPAHQPLRAELTARLLEEYSALTPLFPIPPWNS